MILLCGETARSENQINVRFEDDRNDLFSLERRQGQDRVRRSLDISARPNDSLDTVAVSEMNFATALGAITISGKFTQSLTAAGHEFNGNHVAISIKGETFFADLVGMTTGGSRLSTSGSKPSKSSIESETRLALMLRGERIPLWLLIPNLGESDYALLAEFPPMACSLVLAQHLDSSGRAIVDQYELSCGSASGVIRAIALSPLTAFLRFALRLEKHPYPSAARWNSWSIDSATIAIRYEPVYYEDFSLKRQFGEHVPQSSLPPRGELVADIAFECAIAPRFPILSPFPMRKSIQLERIPLRLMAYRLRQEYLVELERFMVDR